MVARVPTITTARRKAKTRSSRSSSRKIACQGFRSFDATILPTPTIALRPAAPAVGAEREPRRDGGDGQEREPALDPVNVAQHALDLVGEDVGEPEAHRDADHGEREPPPEDLRAREDAGCDDRDLFGHGQTEPGGQQDEEQPDVMQVLDQGRDQTAPREDPARVRSRTVYTPERAVLGSL